MRLFTINTLIFVILYNAALDTSGKFASFSMASIETKETVISTSPIPMGDESANVLTQIVNSIAQKGITLKEIDHWTVGIGPGSFTGIRMGIAMIKGICAGTDASYRGLPSSLAMALEGQLESKEKIGVLHDGRHDEMILSLYFYENGIMELKASPTPHPFHELRTKAINRFVILKDDRALSRLPDLGAPLSIVDCVDSEKLLYPEGWDWPQNIEEVERSIEPHYIRPAVFIRTSLNNVK